MKLERMTYSQPTLMCMHGDTRSVCNIAATDTALGSQQEANTCRQCVGCKGPERRANQKMKVMEVTVMAGGRRGAGILPYQSVPPTNSLVILGRLNQLDRCSPPSTFISSPVK